MSVLLGVNFLEKSDFMLDMKIPGQVFLIFLVLIIKEKPHK